MKISVAYSMTNEKIVKEVVEWRECSLKRSTKLLVRSLLRMKQR